MNNKKISVIMVDGSFRERFSSFFTLCEQTLPKDQYEIIWLEFYDQVNPKLQAQADLHANTKIIKLGRKGTYHSSYCFNRGILESSGDILVIPDGDLVFEKDFLETVLKDHSETDKLLQYFHRFNQAKDQILAGMPIDEYSLDHLKKVCKITDPSNWGACLTVRKKWLLEINGYEMHPIFETGYHRNDVDVYCRLKNLGLLVRWHPTFRVYHPWHPGTEGAPVHHTRQIEVASFRAQNQMIYPFQGIDSSKDLAPTEDLLKSLTPLE